MLRIVAGGLLLFLATACGVDAADDQFAREFVEHVRTGNPAGFRQLEPDGEIAQGGWQAVAEMAELLPRGAPEGVRLVEWARGQKHGIRYRQLSYEVERRNEIARVDVYLISHGSRRYVNTLRIQELPGRR